ncbi:MAG: sulfite exporter TauE/SafE family protein [Candidatus Paceibacterota bacterium]|jgi:sulfite exporter TauE/SafE/copper chaperone CopZ
MNNTHTISIKGMHCKSCEVLIENKLRAIQNIHNIHISHKTGVCQIAYDGENLDMTVVEEAVKSAGYSLGRSASKLWLSNNPMDYAELAASGAIVLLLYAVLSTTGLLDVAIKDEGNASLLTVLIIGLTAGISSCMALVGGLVLGLSAEHAVAHPEATSLQNFRPHIFFNLGRIISYTLLGGVIGYLGSVFLLSQSLLGGITIVVGIVMFVLGLSLVGIFPRISGGIAFMPKRISKMLGIHRDGKEYSHTGAFLMGAATFFLPCGFTQAMQLYAVSTGSFVQGALIMGIFALGTLPMLMGIGWLSAYVKGVVGRYFFRIAGIAVIIFGFLSISNGLAQNGINITLPKIVWPVDNRGSTSATSAEIITENGKQIQILRMNEERSGYVPNNLVVKKGIPVRWIINATFPYSCAASFIVPSLGIRGLLKEGENIAEFTPTKTGTIPFMCSMGMYRGSIEVIE